jgi:hypothetical protein
VNLWFVFLKKKMVVSISRVRRSIEATRETCGLIREGIKLRPRHKSSIAPLVSGTGDWLIKIWFLSNFSSCFWESKMIGV